MADSVREKIFAAIKTKVSEVAGIGDVSRAKVDALEIQRYPAAFIVPGNDSVTEYLGEMIDREMTVFIFLWIRAQNNIHATLEAFLPLVQQKLTSDNTLSGEAIDLTENSAGEPFPLNEDQSEAGIVLDYTVRYRVRRDNPFLHS